MSRPVPAPVAEPLGRLFAKRTPRPKARYTAQIEDTSRGRETPLVSGPEPDAGAYLDRLIELRVFGRKPFTTVPAYSADDTAAELVIARLNRPPLRWMSLKEGDAWTFHWRAPVSGDSTGESTAARYARIVSASGATRPLAICRAALKLIQSGDVHGFPPRGDEPRP